MRFKKKSTKDFEEEFGLYLRKYNHLKISLLQIYNERQFAIKIESFFYINSKTYFAEPKSVKLTKTISKKSLDLDNIQKVSNDLIFNWLGIDDSQIVNLCSEKIPTNDEGVMVFRISLCSFPELFVVPAQSV